MRLVVARDPDQLAEMAADLFRDRLRARADLALAVPAGRTPRRMYRRLETLQATEPVDYSRMRVFSVDELCPPAPADGYFWRQVRAEFLRWAAVPAGRCRPFAVDAVDLTQMCHDYERAIAAAGGLDLVMLGLGPNGHIASNEPPAAFDSVTRPVRLLASTVDYILTDEIIQGAVGDRAVTLGVATILAAREVIVLVSGRGKRQALRGLLDGPSTPNLPASALQRHPNCTILADNDARPD